MEGDLAAIRKQEFANYSGIVRTLRRWLDDRRCNRRRGGVAVGLLRVGGQMQFFFHAFLSFDGVKKMLKPLSRAQATQRTILRLDQAAKIGGVTASIGMLRL